MFDTHAHLNFKRFKNNVDEVIKRAHNAGVSNIVIPGTDILSSKKAIEIASQYDGIYAAVGIHPHHAFEIQRTARSGAIPSRSCHRRTSTVTSSKSGNSSARAALSNISTLLSHPKVVAVGEIGIDRHMYGKTKYEKYSVTDEFISIQRELFAEQIKLAVKHKKSLIIHNREAVDDVLEILESNWHNQLERRTVFHCCEPRDELLEYAKNHNIYIGVDGDITYDKSKQEFIKKVPLDMLVLETDSPFLLPEPLRTQKKYPNEPAHLLTISATIAELLSVPVDTIHAITHNNSKQLFNL